MPIQMIETDNKMSVTCNKGCFMIPSFDNVFQ